ncbi:hypothetical protein KXW37_006826, partial [Aspergillus fumigatus]
RVCLHGSQTFQGRKGTQRPPRTGRAADYNVHGQPTGTPPLRSKHFIWSWKAVHAIVEFDADPTRGGPGALLR